MARGVKALLGMQDSYGRWNRAALTGFVTTAYSIHALSKLYPAHDTAPEIFMPGPTDSLVDTIAAYRALAFQPNGAISALPGATHASPQVRYWAMIALGAAHDERAVEALLAGVGDPVKMVREAARWGLRQTLLDDKGWDKLFPYSGSASDLAREQIAAALIMRADAVMPRSGVGFGRLGAALERMMNSDPSPAVRAWASRAAWNWWIWNPPARQSINASALRALEREENVLAETRLLSLEGFIANGQRANPSSEHQYPVEAALRGIAKRLDAGASQRMQDRLTAIAGTYYSQAGGDGGRVRWVTSRPARRR